MALISRVIKGEFRKPMKKKQEQALPQCRICRRCMRFEYPLLDACGSCREDKLPRCVNFRPGEIHFCTQTGAVYVDEETGKQHEKCIYCICDN